MSILTTSTLLDMECRKIREIKIEYHSQGYLQSKSFWKACFFRATGMSCEKNYYSQNRNNNTLHSSQNRNNNNSSINTSSNNINSSSNIPCLYYVNVVVHLHCKRQNSVSKSGDRLNSDYLSLVGSSENNLN